MAGERKSPKYLTKLDQIEALDPHEQEQLRPVADQFVFRTNEYYQSLIDWTDPADPIRRIIMPDVQELDEFGDLDASDELSYTVLKGLEHKYEDTALLLVNNVCGGYCRFCFRKRLFTAENDEVTNDVGEAIRYIRDHREITNVLLTGGDPLVMSTDRLEGIIRQVRDIPHVGIIRIGTKIPAFNPFRILNDPLLPEMLSRYSTAEKKIYIMNHFNHPRELTELAVQGLVLLQKAGVTTVNQSPMIRGVNDDPVVLAELLNRLSYNGVLPYYIFICRPTSGNESFMMPVEECLRTFESARLNLSGLAKHVRLCMSHKTGKVEVIGKLGGRMVFRYHRAASPLDRGRAMIFDSNPDACWFDDYLVPVPKSAVAVLPLSAGADMARPAI